MKDVDKSLFLARARRNRVLFYSRKMRESKKHLELTIAVRFAIFFVLC